MQITKGLGSFFFSSLPFPRKREAKYISRKKLDARLCWHDGKYFVTSKIIHTATQSNPLE
jgi:hypothetical protein